MLAGNLFVSPASGFSIPSERKKQLISTKPSMNTLQVVGTIHLSSSPDTMDAFCGILWQQSIIKAIFS